MSNRVLGRLRPFSTSALMLMLALAVAAPLQAQQVPRGGWTTYRTGAFGPVLPWPVVPIHAVLLPDGRVMSYGTDGAGAQGALLQYAVWDPALGTGSGAHLVLPNTTRTDVFCSAQTVLPSGAVLLTGGNNTTDWAVNLSVNDITFFDFQGNQLIASPQKMALPRWYPSVLTLANGDALVLGGRANPTTPTSTPEIYSQASGWRPLPGAANDEAYGGADAWIYPRAWQAPTGPVFVMAHSGATFHLDPTGAGSLTRTSVNLPAGHPYLPSVMYAPGKIFSVRASRQVVTVDINSMTPIVRSGSSIDQTRYHANATVLPDGTVFINGGSTVDNQAVGVAYTSRLWSPTSGSWTAGAKARQMRLYHSVSLLLPDATVLTGGGGAPGPQTNLNAEIYYPPYLYRKDWSGLPATRPVVISAPTSIAWGERFSVRANTSISRVTLVRMGSATHAHNFDQRFIELRLGGSGSTRTVDAPLDAQTAPPGFYMLFVLNASGVPSVAKVVRLGA